jgi:hypothetical protein
MNKAQQARFDSLYEKHVSALKRPGKSAKSVEAYTCAVRWTTAFLHGNVKKLLIFIQYLLTGVLKTATKRFCHLHPSLPAKWRRPASPVKWGRTYATA